MVIFATRYGRVAKIESILVSLDRRALSSIASSTACEGAGASETEGAALRPARSLDVLAVRSRLRRHYTTRSLDVDVAIATVSSTLFNGTAFGLPDEPPRADEDSPLLRKASLCNKLDRPKRKVPDSDYIEFYKKWRSLENVADAKSGAKTPRFAIRSWLLGIFGGGARSTSSSLRRAPHLLDRESAV